MKKGKFIVMDGCEGAGKSTQLKKLAKHFKNKAVFTREPGGTPYAEEIRDLILKSKHAKKADAKTLLALFWAARADHMKNKIVPALKAGKTVITDRFDSSTYAYQIFASGDKELEKQFFAFREYFLDGHKPDLYLFLDVDIKEGLRRKNNKDTEINHIDKRPIDFFKKTRTGFLKFLTKVPSVIIDANPPVDQVFEKIKLILESDRRLKNN